MLVIHARNVQDAFYKSVRELRAQGVKRDSRNGPVYVFPEPVTTVYRNPAERVLMDPVRDANPFFHFMESLWMLAGRNDVEFVSIFSSNISSFSDDGYTFNGAYGNRWRRHFGRDQLTTVMDALYENPDDRRQVVAMWDGHHDLGLNSKDLPCNLMVHFQINVDGRLDMTVFNRSNDLVWGCYGANVVHFSYLQEYVAAGIGVEMGRYYQVSDNLHGYEATSSKFLEDLPKPHLMYEMGVMEPYPLIGYDEDMEDFDADLTEFIDWILTDTHFNPRTSFFEEVAVPMYRTWTIFKSPALPSDLAYQMAIDSTDGIAASDWRLACKEWLQRREANYKRKQLEKK